jgi:type IX secretion system PorP/SprF family membrane protein
MKQFKNNFLFAFCLLLLSAKAMAQVDPHFTQFYANPVWLNPALTGAIDGDYRVSAIHRNQWASITDAYTTYGISGEMVTNKNLNFGVNLLNQTAGDGGFNFMNVYGSVAYTGMRLGENQNHRITFGLQAGIISRRFDPSKLQFGTQWNPITGYNGGLPTGESFATTSSSVLDINLGVAYYDVSPNQKMNWFGGIAAAHVTSPEDPFIGAGQKKSLPMRINMHGGVRMNLGNNLTLVPNFIYMRQGNANQFMLGAYAQMNVNDDADFMFGANMRFNDALAPFIGLNYKDVVLGLSYDVNTTDLGKSVSGTNSFELSLSFVGRKTKKYASEAFPCPRL